MNVLIANQYGRVQGEVGGIGLTLAVSAQTPRRESVQLQTRIDSVEPLLHLLAILRAVERRIEQFQLRDAKTPQPTEPDGAFDESICTEGELFTSNGNSKNKIYGRFAQFLVYEQVDQGRLRVFFAVRDEAKRVARFDLHPGEVQAFHALAKRALFAFEQVDLLLRDDLSLSIGLNVSGHGVRFEAHTPLWHSQFAISKANDLATLAVFTEYREAIRLKPDFADAHYSLGYALLQGKGDNDGAIAELREAIRLKPGVRAHTSLGQALQGKGDLDGAITEYREAIRLKPDYAGTHYILAMALEVKGEKQAALTEYRKAFELDPGNKQARAFYERLSKELEK
jgi:tetratricopeptide (TPR) repeat protein